MGSKKTFFLFEILVALSLMGVLISLLFSFMVQSVRVEKKMEKARSVILERQRFQIRIQDLLTTLSSQPSLPSLYTQKFPKEETESLIVFFDYGIDPDPSFSGIVTGRIYIDENHDLCLACWPTQEDKEHLWRKEILLSDVSSFSLQFLTSLEKSNPEESKAIWKGTWPKEKKGLPCIIRVILEKENRTLQFAFRLPHTHPIPTYWSSPA